ncbi:VENN motif pre-toxin domain-containing protein [Pantoea sp.]|uniref:VENN motif pre-toxin domain-containing protein n=1 Tax=Pantoea sp. TaxID=69393 RepID=UPI0028B0DA25|nr:VENN motif pre-toxin domain-containing protein [Pantoea sp.]
MTTTKDANGKDVVNVQANLMAHAVVGAVTAYAAGNSAVAGASGAAMGEYIAQQMYPGVDRNDLSEEQRQTISALGTLAAGLADGVTGDSTAGAVAGAQAGRNAVENNSLSGLDGFGTGFWNNVQAQGSLINNTNLIDEKGKVLNPATTEEIKYASDKLVTGQLPDGQNAATGLLTAWGAGATTVVAPVLLPTTATAGSVIGASAIGGAANVFNQLNSGEPFSATDALIATGISGVTQGKGFWFTEAVSITGAYVGASLQGKDVAAPMIGAGLGTLGGATIGKGVEKVQSTIPQFTIPKITGAVAESAGSEYLGSSAQSLAEKFQKKLEKNNAK